MTFRSLAERVFLWLARALPVRIARHCMHLLRQDPATTDRWGYHVRPIHYYEPIPDFRALDQTKLAARREPKGVSIDVDSQVSLLRGMAKRYSEEIRLLNERGSQGFPFENEFFGGLDAALYYSIIRDLKPARIVEIGAGYSTRIAAKALAKNRSEGAMGSLIVVEPYPEPRLTSADIEMELIVQPVERVDLAIFRQLDRNDLLFIDSSHALRCGGDVAHEYLEILPELNAGVWIHVHDIFFPFDYPADWILERRLAFNEQYLLEAFLAFNSEFKVELAGSWLATDAPQVAAELFALKSGTRPSSFWMSRRIRV